MLSQEGQAFLLRIGFTEVTATELLIPHPVPLSLVLGLIHTESAGNADAMRFEPAYKYLFETKSYAVKHGWTDETEKALQMFSYGLMQIMGAVAREHGFNLHPKLLLVPKINLAWGLLHLWSLKQRFGNWQDAVAAYNYGHPAKSILTGKYKNQAYVDKVFQATARFEAKK